MAFTTVPTVATGDLWTAANHNTYIRDNFSAGVPAIFTTKGDLPAGTGLKQAARLGVGANGTALIADSGQASGMRWGLDFLTKAAWTTKGDLMGATGAGAPARLPVGANGSALIADSTQAGGLRWGLDFVTKALMTAKGDLLAASGAGVPVRLAVGANGKILVADSAAAAGMKWDTPPTPQFFEATRTTNISTSSATYADAISMVCNLTYVSTVLIFAYGVFRPTALYGAAEVRLVTNGTVGPITVSKSCNSGSTDISWVPFSIMDIVPSVAAGNRTLQLQYHQGGDTGNPVELDRAHLLALAFPE